MIGSVQLWGADDHLLSVTETSVSESYRRFYYADIEALIVRRSDRLWLITVLVFVGWVLCALILSSSGALTDTTGIRLFGIVSGAAVLFLLINGIMGHFGIIHVQTPLGQFRLAAAVRLREARVILRVLADAVNERQAAPSEGVAPGTEGHGGGTVR